jgi:hypothetical protein
VSEDMDAVTMGAVLAAVAGGAGGALGAQVWAGVTALVRRPFRRAHAAGDITVSPASGEVEQIALQEAPTDEGRAIALAEVLIARAATDYSFRQAMINWWAQASQIRVGGEVISTISDGIFHGPVLQGRDFTGLTFGSSPASNSSSSSLPYCSSQDQDMA